jgi:2-polyprenyl-3-methyl-5-hydroxy-6-metoxy-1,4-benzoquinol methylase
MKSESMWNRLAKTYDTPGVSLGENDLKIIEHAKKYLNSGSIVMDYGCATGSIAIELAGIAEAVYGIDFSAKMIEIAERKAGESNLANVHFLKATIFDDKLEEGSFDLILGLSILHLIKDPTLVVTRINQLLKPGGIFISATPCLGINTFRSTLIRVPLLVLSKLGILPHINFFSVSGLAASIKNQNFDIIENECISDNPVTDAFIVARKI